MLSTPWRFSSMAPASSKDERCFITSSLDESHRLTEVNGLPPASTHYANVKPETAFRHACAAFILLMVGAIRTVAADAKLDINCEVSTRSGLVECSFKGRKLLAYSFATNQFKPYVREFYSLSAENVLLDAPPDHLHHHGLMFAIRVNGVNFWEERDQPGHEVHVRMLAHQSGWNARGLPEASFTELIHWVPDGAQALRDTTPAAFLIERRTLTLAVDETAEEVSLAWHAEFQVGARTNRVQLHGSDYNGLGLRLPAAWNHVAQHQNSEHAPYATGGKRDVFPARWSTVSPSARPDATQVALLARPLGHPGTNMFFSMTDPFTYLSATINLDKKPLELRPDDRFSLDYLVLVYPTRHAPEQLERRFQTWAKAFQ